MAKQKGTVDKWKIKKWYKVVLPENFNSREVAETVASSEENLMNRRVDVSLRNITGNIGHQHVKITLEINQIKGDKAFTELTGFELHRDYLKRMIRKRMSVIEIISDVVCKDGKRTRVKTFVFTRRRIDASQKGSIRKIVEDIVNMEAKNSDSGRLVQDSIFGKISSQIYKEIKRIVPIKRVEIARVKMVKEKKESTPEKG